LSADLVGWQSCTHFRQIEHRVIAVDSRLIVEQSVLEFELDSPHAVVRKIRFAEGRLLRKQVPVAR